MDDHRDRPLSRNRRLCALVVSAAYALATLQFLRAYFIVDQPYLDAARYEAGLEKMPYQGRVLMAEVMRYASGNRVMSLIAGKLRGPLHAPDVVAELLMDLLSMVAIAWTVRRFYRVVSPAGTLGWMPYFLVLWMAAETYIVRFQEAIYFPYDLLAAALFAVCVYLCYRERYLLLVPIFVVACFNRETIVMVLPLIVVNAYMASRRRVEALAYATGLAVVWAAIHVALTRHFAGNETELGLRLHENIRFLLTPQTWPQIASACGFLLPVPFVFWRLLPELRLRLYALLIPVWCVIMLGVGLLPESRIFGELIGLLAVLCTVIFERMYRPGVSEPVPSPSHPAI